MLSHQDTLCSLLLRNPIRVNGRRGFSFCDCLHTAKRWIFL